MKARAKWTWVAAAALALLTGIVGGGYLRPKGNAFDPTASQDEKKVQEGVRLAMADRITATKMLSGKTRAEVVSMLGESPKTGYFRDWDLVYWLGPERGWISIDSEWLVVRFYGQDRVSDYRIVRD